MKFRSLLLAFFIILTSLLTAQAATPNTAPGTVQHSWIRINQLGYLKKSVKVAVMLSKENIAPKSFELCDALTDKVVWSSKSVKSFGRYGTFENSFRLDFSKFGTEGAYYIKSGDAKSPRFRIADDVYDGTADFLLKYMRQQQCGYNPFSGDSCHTHDGFIIFHPDPKIDSTHIDVTGGWHDASDYLQYVTTSATAVYQLLFAYKQNPGSFGDEYDKNGNPGANGIPDILDVAKWGMDWLVKMNPKAEMMFNQIADDRDHGFFKRPDQDMIDYGRGKGGERPVYFVTDKPQGVFKYKNRSTGVASTAGKFASAFAMGSEVLKDFYPDFANMLKQKSVDAYAFGLKYPGVCQTAPCVSPYFYEEDNWVDDMELAAAQLYKMTKDDKYLKDASDFARKEPVTPWMGADTARHYQWFPFINLGHYQLCDGIRAECDGNGATGTVRSATKNAEPSTSNVEHRTPNAARRTPNAARRTPNEFVSYIKRGVDTVFQKAKKNPFMMGIPFIWCSNNLVSAMATQSHLYYDLTKDPSYREMEAALRDWLFGCNPWGTSMIIGLPANGDYPVDPHSAFSSVDHMQIDGGLVDGPVYTTIFKVLKGLTLTRPDQYADFQPGRIIYHDDWGDYSTNEPTMDGTASLAYFLSAMQKEGAKCDGKSAKCDGNGAKCDGNGAKCDGNSAKCEVRGATKNAENSTSNVEHRTSNTERRTPNVEHRTSNSELRTSNSELRTSPVSELGGIIRFDRSKKEIHLVFTAHEFADGADVIRKVLKKHNAKASFFFTGDFYRIEKYAPIIKALKKDGHYLGAHSNKHILYATWEKRDSLLVTKDEFINDLKANYAEMEKFGIKKSDAQYFMPPFEWFNQKISDWTKEIGLTLINFTPGTSSNADYTTPDMVKQYLSSDEIYKRIMEYEKTKQDGLNGFILLTHFGTDSKRTDKFYNKLDKLITELEAKGYKFTRL